MATKKDNVKEEPQKYRCSTCGRTVGEREYYGTFSDKYASCGGKLPHCKNCIKESFEKSFLSTSDVMKSIMATCMRFDVPYSETMIVDYDRDLLDIDEAIKVWYEYIKMANSIHKKIGGKSSCDYESLASKILESQSVGDDDEVLHLSDTLSSIEIDETEIKFFGSGYTRRQYKLLTESFLALIGSFECPNSMVASIYKDLSFLDMRIEEAKRNGEQDKVLTNLMDARRKLFKDAGIDAYKKDKDNKVEGIGAMIKRMEQTRPAADPLPDWDNNKLEKIANIIAGHIMFAEGEKNSVVDKYLEILEPYSVDIAGIIGGEGDDE